MSVDKAEDLQEGPVQIAPVGGEASAQPGQLQLAPLSEAPIQVEVRIGSACLSLGELMKLRPGMVVTLARRVGEPAEILVGGKLIALGQIVLVGEELGVRVTDFAGVARVAQ